MALLLLSSLLLPLRFLHFEGSGYHTHLLSFPNDCSQSATTTYNGYKRCVCVCVVGSFDEEIRSIATHSQSSASFLKEHVGKQNLYRIRKALVNNNIEKDATVNGTRRETPSQGLSSFLRLRSSIEERLGQQQGLPLADSLSTLSLAPTTTTHRSFGEQRGRDTQIIIIIRSSSPSAHQISTPQHHYEGSSLVVPA